MGGKAAVLPRLKKRMRAPHNEPAGTAGVGAIEKRHCRSPANHCGFAHCGFLALGAHAPLRINVLAQKNYLLIR